MKAEIDIYVADYPQISGLFEDEVTGSWAPAWDTNLANHKAFHASIMTYGLWAWGHLKYECQCKLTNRRLDLRTKPVINSSIFRRT
jgi:hypothetical protein